MPSAPHKDPPDQAQRNKALDTHCSILVRAPAGSGKTTLLAERFLRLLAEVEEPGQIVAITFTKAAAAEMRNRILDELRKEDPGPIARRALEHSHALGWNLLDLPAQLRIQTIDSFCRDLALQQPLLSGLGGSLEINEQPIELYRRAARRTLQQIDRGDPALREAIEVLLLWRDNSWPDLETQLVAMLEKRDQWMHDFLLDRNPDWGALRKRLERPIARANPTDPALARYTEDEWYIVRACFTLLRHAAAELRVVFAEAAAADFTEVAQIALKVLRGDDGLPTDAALAVADGICHLLVDEFQDTSRRQHQLLTHLIAAWPEREGRTCFVVGDPMQSIYFFRDADAELFPYVEQLGLEVPGDLPLRFDPVLLNANFRSAPALVESNNETFAKVFAGDDGSGVRFMKAEPARDDAEADTRPGPRVVAASVATRRLHIEFIPDSARGAGTERKEQIAAEREAAQQKQIDEIIDLIRSHQPGIDAARAKNEKKSVNEKKEEYRIAVLARARKSLEPIASALRDANIPFRAVELERLQDCPEIIDALALARALFNPHDRVAWLGVLRAPWCGLSLADLHMLASADDSRLIARAVPELLAERMQLLSSEGRLAAERLLLAMESSERLRSTHPVAAPGTWLEQAWLRLGGAQCVDRTGRANLDLFWRTLDKLPRGEPDLLGPALDEALKDLRALPDPSSDGNCGVQLMTIHGAKGLEFKVVIVPDLQAPPGRAKPGMLSWLERGIPPEFAATEPGESREVTEFVIAPFSSKGSDPGKAKKWVDRQRTEREKQESRRLLYVACTRARDELHLFARPEYKTEKDGSRSLVEPRESLLRTAWPAFSAEIETRFGEWVATTRKPVTERAEVESGEVEFIAAAGESNLVEMPAPANSAPKKATQLRRLPVGFRVNESELSPAAPEALPGAGRLYERHEGGLLSRAFGKAVHALLQQLAHLLETQASEEACRRMLQLKPRIAAEIRAAGVEASQAGHLAEQAIEAALKAAADPIGKWILAPHAEAQNEIRWTGVIAGSLRTVQVDRIFRAGPAPQITGAAAGEEDAQEDTWWIVDYKTAHEEDLDRAAALPELRRIFAPQIEAYAKILRNLRGANAAVRGGLYYPRMALLDWWEM